MKLSYDSIERARRELDDLVRWTPALRLAELECGDGPELWAKSENLQYIGAFKARGAQLAVNRLAPSDRQRGVLTYSSGNHAQAVALAAKRQRVAATIVMPEDAPSIKVEGVRSLGADVVFAGTTSLQRKARAEELAQQSGCPIIEPFDHPDTICGQGTATLELRQDVEAAAGPMDALVVCVGGAGLIAGACLALEGSDTEIHSAEPVGCDSLRQSLAAGRVTAVEPGPTLADGLKPTRIGELNFQVCRNRVTASHLVTDDELEDTMRALARVGLVVEPSGAAALAVARRGLPGSPERVGVMLSGRNVAPSLLARILGGSPAAGPTPR